MIRRMNCQEAGYAFGSNPPYGFRRGSFTTRSSRELVGHARAAPTRTSPISCQANLTAIGVQFIVPQL
jgi:hypothetical protein